MSPSPHGRALLADRYLNKGTAFTAEERQQVIKQSLVAGHYEQAVDRESAYEKLAAARGGTTTASGNSANPGATTGNASPSTAQDGGGIAGELGKILLGSTGPRGGRKEGMLEAAAKSAARAVGSQVGREIIRGVLGGLLGGRRR